MPTRFIHSRSAVMPSLVTLPFSQCHHTRGLAESGGSLKPRSSASREVCPGAQPARHTNSPASAKIRILASRVLLILRHLFSS